MLNLFLDSGAFSAFTQKTEVNLHEYTDFCIANQQYITQAVNLDVINPGRPDEAAAAGMQNFHYMLDKGVKAMPVYHARESKRYLDEMIDLVDYVGLSGTSLVSPAEDKQWHHLTWAYITDKHGFPTVRTHSFGNTSEYMAMNFPWTTMDSATWMIQAGRAGRVKLQGRPYQLRTHSIGDQNYISVHDTGLKREAWEKEFRQYGLDPNQLMTVEAKGAKMAMLRSFVVASELLNLQARTEPVKSYKGGSTLLLHKRKDEGGFSREGPAQLYFVISPSAFSFNFPLIAALGIKNVLVSYFYVVTAPKNFWEERLLPFLHDPVGYCTTHPKVRVFWDKLHEVILPKIAQTV